MGQRLARSGGEEGEERVGVRVGGKGRVGVMCLQGGGGSDDDVLQGGGEGMMCCKGR